MAYKQRWAGFFDLFDSDGSGFISLADVKGAAQHFIKTFGLKPGTKEYDGAVLAYDHFFAGFIKDVDQNGDGKVTREELANAVEKAKAAGISAAPGWWRSANAELFQVVDTNHNGEISLQELTEFTKKVTPNQSQEAIRKAYEWALKTANTPVLNGEAFWILNFVWGVSEEPNPELDIIFPYWRKY
eukprot:Phypoly_transcript_19125.p1 GENE.Phypoly_transcript_19125~~Phypoly_transcript_19125.p1  ORF type:complete len:186 (+),score=39.20 Phypoly_transcript_19125:119-676(+)